MVKVTTQSNNDILLIFWAKLAAKQLAAVTIMSDQHLNIDSIKRLVIASRIMMKITLALALQLWNWNQMN
jgi:hypothetical protein